MYPINPEVVDLSRFQFALTALYHFMFVPLTLGLTFMLAAMETTYVVTGRKIYKDMTQFWGKLFGINFAIGVATGLTMEFEFGTNWSMYSHFFGDVFGTPLAIEGLMAFFMESTFVGLMFFGWDRMSKQAHLAITWLVALGSNLSALWILVANANMNMPQGAHFDPETMRMTFDNITKVLFNEDAQAKFVHTSLAGYVSASMFVMGISAFYLLRGQHKQFAARSFRMAALFGLISTVGVITLGDALGRLDYMHQPTKIAAMEGIWETTKPPYEPWVAFALPDDKTQVNHLEIGIPFVLTPLVAHDFTTPITGMKELEEQAGPRIRSGITALSALHEYDTTHSADALATFHEHEADMGYGFLAAIHAPGHDVTNIPEDQIDRVVQETQPEILPNVFVTFWSFRVMVCLGLWFFVVFAFSAYTSLRNRLDRNHLLLKLTMWSIPLPILASSFGWITAEAGRQPWTVFNYLPTFLSASTHTVSYMIFSLAGFALLYTIFIAAELYLMFKFARLGPDYHGAHAHEAEDHGVNTATFAAGMGD
ncbi:MAG: cytochrome ubiquinol oxidase subunit I [Acetobacter sp.]|nr:cytochrome ubiquinol oxidase subunit I [Acetobacter sp.]MCH4062136.1 cytochrome ubiquinol oxidase subunit I [Acetobacter sp.]MCH4089017.1 cytochrome ubiquinol oxidase subunit I [Acetobacter sp.]MCI1293259.1 cytochrome ubiquinol oxidase subunit I [Acetobacter sp.]MCI1320118.1 cytochrome ubiquinol oxidase subunit I [Acetobacter sp.]